MKNYQLKQVGAFAVFGLLIGTIGVNAAIGNNVDVAAEVQRIEDNLGKLKAPPELVNTVLEQLQTQCNKTNQTHTIDQSLLNNMTECLAGNFNETQLIGEIKESIPQGKLDSVFRNMCLKWPKMKECVNRFFTVIGDCWQKGDKVVKFVDGFVKFFCGDDNDGARIALFFAEGGMKCLEDHGDTVKKCIEEKVPDNVRQLNDVNLHDMEDVKNTLQNFKPGPEPTHDEICSKLEEVRDCTTVGLKKCKDSTPENLITAMLKEVAKGLECQMKEQRSGLSTSSVGGASSVTKSSLLLIILVFTFATLR